MPFAEIINRLTGIAKGDIVDTSLADVTLMTTVKISPRVITAINASVGMTAWTRDFFEKVILKDEEDYGSAIQF